MTTPDYAFDIITTRQARAERDAAALHLGTILQDPAAPAERVNAAIHDWRIAAGYEDDPLKEAEDDLYAAELAYRRNPDPDGQAEIDAAQKRLDDARTDLEAFQLGNLRYEPVVPMATSSPNYIRGETR